MTISKVNLAEMLEARERRSAIQSGLLSVYRSPLVCLTMNIAGPVKRTPLIRLLFSYGLEQFEAKGFPIVSKRLIDAPTGCEAFYSVAADPQLLKEAVSTIEESFPAARLFDFDVICANGEKLSRPQARACIVCGGPVQICSRSRAHGLERIVEKTDSLLCGFAADLYADEAVNALIREVHTTPKPGLVDENNCGAHPDMDIALFEASANVLHPYFRESVLHGLTGESMHTLREAGKEAERRMFETTNGINTHKGAVFSFGLLLSAIGNALQNETNIYTRVKELLASEIDPTGTEPKTHGDAVRANYGKFGAAEEAKAGYPSAKYATERLAYYRDQFAFNPDALVLCDLMACVDDTNIYHRGGAEGAAFVRNESRRICSLPVEDRIRQLELLDDKMIEKKLSAGGCADLLALCFLIDRWNKDSTTLFIQAD